jgi:hypothetical protein
MHSTLTSSSIFNPSSLLLSKNSIDLSLKIIYVFSLFMKKIYSLNLWQLITLRSFKNHFFGNFLSLFLIFYTFFVIKIYNIFIDLSFNLFKYHQLFFDPSFIFPRRCSCSFRSYKLFISFSTHHFCKYHCLSFTNFIVLSSMACNWPWPSIKNPISFTNIFLILLWNNLFLMNWSLTDSALALNGRLTVNILVDSTHIDFRLRCCYRGIVPSLNMLLHLFNITKFSTTWTIWAWHLNFLLAFETSFVRLSLS